MKIDFSPATFQHVPGIPELLRRRSEKVPNMDDAADVEPGERTQMQHYARLARLLTAADAALASNPGSAKHCIARALAMLEPRIMQRAPTECARGGLAPWQVRRLVDYVEANCTEKLRSEDLAHIAKLSVGYFIRAFKATFGETPHAYVIRRRIMQAKAMMLETNMPLGQIAIACGFSDQAHFSRRFREVVSTSPQRWRHARRDMPVEDVPANA